MSRKLTDDLWNGVFDYLPQFPKTFAILQRVQKQWSIDKFVPKFEYSIFAPEVP